jgi:methyl-accepting chemotaxis protein
LSVAEQTLSKLAADDKAAAMQSIQHVRSIMDDLSAFNEAVAKNAIDLNIISTNVEQNVLVVISTLQFQDMSSQLIEHARLRMTALQEVANEMGKTKSTGGRPTRSEYLAQIAAYNRLLDKHVVSLDKQKASPVKQKDFGTGDIELF